MKILIDYNDVISSQRVVIRNIDTNEAFWTRFYLYISEYIPNTTIFFSKESIAFPWHLFLAYRASVNNFFKANDVEVALSDVAKVRLLNANDASYRKALTFAQRTKEEIINHLKRNNFNRTLTDNQLNNLIKISQLPAAATFSVPGAGKTTEALAYFFLNASDNNRLLVVAPKNAFGAWDEQLSDCMPLLNDHFYRLRGGESNISAILGQKPRFMIVTYEQFPTAKLLLTELLAEGNVFMFLDESHRIKGGRQGVRADAILDVAHLPCRKLVMSGTPMPQSVKDMIPQFSFLYPETRSDENNIIDLMKRVYVRTTKGQLGIEPVVHEVKRLPMPPLQRELYDTLKSETKRQLNTIIRDKSKQQLRKIGKCVLKVIEFTSNPALLASDFTYTFDRRVGELLSLSNGPKIDYVCKKARELAASGKKVIIWSCFVRNVELIAGRLSDIGADYIHGGVDAGSEEDFDTREGKIKKFHDDPNSMVLVANPAACSEGISLHKVCQNAIYLDRSFNATHYLQSEDRIHRLGLAPGVQPHVMIVECEDSIDQVISARLTQKIDRMAVALEDESLNVTPDAIDYLDDDMDEEDALTSDDAQAILDYFFGDNYA